MPRVTIGDMVSASSTILATLAQSAPVIVEPAEHQAN
jgi:hypothetical protein